MPQVLRAHNRMSGQFSKSKDEQMNARMEALRGNLGDMLFGMEMDVTYRCVETDAEEPYTVRESLRNLKCNINDKTAHLYSAIETSLEEHVEKRSPTLGRDAQYEVKRQIARLPPYLAVQFVRFAYRQDTNKRAKILRNVTFPDVLDIRNLCATKLRAGIGAYCTTLETDIGVVPMSDKAKEAAAAPAAAPAAAGSSEPTPMEEPKIQRPTVVRSAAAMIFSSPDMGPSFLSSSLARSGASGESFTSGGYTT